MVQTGVVQTGTDEDGPSYAPVYTQEALGHDHDIVLDRRLHDAASHVLRSGPAGGLPEAALISMAAGILGHESA